MKGTTESGFEFELKEDALDDYELLESLAKADKGDIWIIPELVDRLLGEEQKEALKKHIRDKSGRVSLKKMSDEIASIFTATGKLKNS